MRHLVKGRKLNRTASHRKATLAALSIALIQERRIQTTVAKAKELRRFIEPLITKAKVDTTHNRRQVFSKLNDKYAVTELFEEVGPLAKDRPGGYTRVLKLGFRVGDAAEMAMIELVDYNDVSPEDAEKSQKRTRRAGRSKKSASASEAPQEKTEASQKEAESETVDSPAETSDIAVNESDDAGTPDVQSSTDLNVDEVKEKIESMTVDEAKDFIGDDERVTVQKALQKKIDAAEG